MTDLTTQTPVEIDTQIAAIYVRWYAQLAENARPAGWLDSAKDDLAVAKGEKKSRYQHYSERDIPTLEKRIADLTERVVEGNRLAADIMRETAPFNAEFTRRGGWSRFYLVDNTGGHVHSSMHCSTCYDTRMVNGVLTAGTQFIWLPKESGKNEAEIIAKANEQACTICFPGAPVDHSRKGGFEAPARKAAREERAAAKAERDAKRAAKAITTPEGEALKVLSYHIGERRIQERDGSIRVVPPHDTFETLTTAHAAKAFLTDSQDSYGGKRDVDVDLVSRSLAAKFGTTAEEEIAAAYKRAQKRR